MLSLLLLLLLCRERLLVPLLMHQLRALHPVVVVGGDFSRRHRGGVFGRGPGLSARRRRPWRPRRHVIEDGGCNSRFGRLDSSQVRFSLHLRLPVAQHPVGLLPRLRPHGFVHVSPARPRALLCRRAAAPTAKGEGFRLAQSRGQVCCDSCFPKRQKIRNTCKKGNCLPQQEK